MVRLERECASALESVAVRYTCLNVPLFLGHGDLDYACNGCGQVVCHGATDGDLLPALVVRCACGVVNRAPRSGRARQ